jgi:UDP-2,3-diacylglucosamine pyrophosphatase LpxH
MKVVRRIMKFITEGIPVYYLTGNHDEMLRKFADFDLGSFKLMNKVVLNIDGKKAWIFHGDVFDVTMQHSKWLAKLGAVGYDTLISINNFTNWMLAITGREKMSFSKKVKAKFKDAVKFINQFEQTAADLAVDKKYKYVICGHIHQAEIRKIESTEKKGSVVYMNSGDWVESLTALEYNDKQWKIFQYRPEDFIKDTDEDDKHDAEDLDAKLDVMSLLERFRQE